MGFSKVSYGRGREIFKIRVEDSDGKKLDHWVVMKDDFAEVCRILIKKYGLKYNGEDSDLDWAR